MLVSAVQQCESVISIVVQSLSRFWIFATHDRSIQGFPVLHYFPEFAQIRFHWVNDASNHLILCPHFSTYPQSFPASGSLPMSWLFVSVFHRTLSMEDKDFHNSWVSKFSVKTVYHFRQFILKFGNAGTVQICFDVINNIMWIFRYCSHLLSFQISDFRHKKSSTKTWCW